MVGLINPPTIGELGQMLDLLNKYQSYLVYEHQEGMLEEEHPFDLAQRELAINRIEDCKSTIADDLMFRLTNF